MTSGYYCAIFPFCGGGKKKKKKKDDKKTKAFYDWATTGIPVKMFVVCVLTLSRLLQLNTTDRELGMPMPQMNFGVFDRRSLSTSS